MEDRPWLFDDIPSLHPEVQFYTARRSNVEAPKEYKFNLNALVAYLLAYFNFIQVANAGTAYASDAAAGAGGVAVDEVYELSAGNDYGLPEGLFKKRKS